MLSQDSSSSFVSCCDMPSGRLIGIRATPNGRRRGGLGLTVVASSAGPERADGPEKAGRKKVQRVLGNESSVNFPGVSQVAAEGAKPPIKLGPGTHARQYFGRVWHGRLTYFH